MHARTYQRTHALHSFSINRFNTFSICCCCCLLFEYNSSMCTRTRHKRSRHASQYPRQLTTVAPATVDLLSAALANLFRFVRVAHRSLQMNNNSTTLLRSQSFAFWFSRFPMCVCVRVRLAPRQNDKMKKNCARDVKHTIALKTSICFLPSLTLCMCRKERGCEWRRRQKVRVDGDFNRVG